MGVGGGTDEKVEDQKCETFPVIKGCLAREALLLLSTLSIINAAAAFIQQRVNANTAPTHTLTSCLSWFYSVTGEHTHTHAPGMYIRL